MVISPSIERPSLALMISALTHRVALVCTAWKFCNSDMNSASLRNSCCYSEPVPETFWLSSLTRVPCLRYTRTRDTLRMKLDD